MRKSSDVEKYSEYDKFPYGSKCVCYIEQTSDNNIEQVGTRVDERRSVYYRVKHEGSKLYGAWPGQWETDLFEIDDIEAYGKAVNAEKYTYNHKG